MDQILRSKMRVLPNTQDSSKKNDTFTKTKGKSRLRFDNNLQKETKSTVISTGTSPILKKQILYR